MPRQIDRFLYQSNGEYHANKIHQYYSLLCISRYRMDMLATTVRVASRKGKQNPARDGPYAVTEIEMVFKQAAGACVRGGPHDWAGQTRGKKEKKYVMKNKNSSGGRAYWRSPQQRCMSEHRTELLHM